MHTPIHQGSAGVVVLESLGVKPASAWAVVMACRALDRRLVPIDPSTRAERRPLPAGTEIDADRRRAAADPPTLGRNDRTCRTGIANQFAQYKSRMTKQATVV